jgi:peptidoglycan-associated lipoprotein
MKAHLGIVGGLVALLCGMGCSHEQQVTKQPAPPPVVATPSPPPPKQEPVQQATYSPPKDDAVYFDFDSALLRDDARPLLQELAEKVKGNAHAKIRIEGNCDERGTKEYNLGLGAHRAQAAKKYLLSLGVPSSRIETVSYGAERPKYTGHDEDSWAKNRRDDFVTK